MWLSGQADETNWQPENMETDSTSYFETIWAIETEIADANEVSATENREVETLAQVDIVPQAEVEPEIHQLEIQADEPSDSRPDTRIRRVLSIEEMRSKLGVAAGAPPPRPAFDLCSRPRIIRRRDDAACETGFGMAVA